MAANPKPAVPPSQSYQTLTADRLTPTIGAIISGTIADRFSGVVSVSFGASVTLAAALLFAFLQRQGTPEVAVPTA